VPLWIATEGGSIERNLADVEVWKPAFNALIKKILEGLIDLVGKRRGIGDPDKISKYVLLDTRIDYPYQEGSDLIFSERYLRCHAVGGGDDLFSEWQLAWGDLRVDLAQLLEHWPFGQRLGVIAGNKSAKPAANCKLDAEDDYSLSPDPPKQAAPAGAYKLLLRYWPDGKIPQWSIEKLVRKLKKDDPSINAEAIKRALGLKP
jgi:hypothetical protein